jgi:putative ribosome biogenesis GTPase RsgA
VVILLLVNEKGRTPLQDLGMSVKAIDSNKCKFTNHIHSHPPTEQFLEFLAKQGIPFEQFKRARQLVAEPHQRRGTYDG